MGVVRLGKLALRWCFECNLPILESKECGTCNSETNEVRLTPPGDVRPAFDEELRLIRAQIDGQFGSGCGKELVPEDKIVVLNRAPALDRMDEIIMDGRVLGALRYDPGERYKVILRMHAAQAIEKNLTKNWVIVDPGAVNPIMKGANALCVGITDAHPDIAFGDEAVVLDPDKNVIALGKAMLPGKEMVGNKGVGVKTRWHGREEVSLLPSGRTWEDAISANSWFFEKKVPKAIQFIKRVVEREDKEVACSFSGGKDSLATLLLALDAGLSPKILFVDTGLEFEETKSHVDEIAKMFDLEVVKENAHDAFWENVPNFGPPGKDFRWCCKSCKLGPTVRLISKHFPDGVVSLIGQRAYESEQRAKKGRIWENPWVPGQLGVSPIQDWTALHIWLYIFSKKVPYNIWYERGLERIGCFMCPASDMADLEIVKSYSSSYEKWGRFLSDFADDKGYPKEWLEFGLWRWRKLPAGMLDLVERKGIDLKGREKKPPPEGQGRIEFLSAEGYQPCEGGVSIEGVFTRNLDMVRISNLMNILGDVSYDDKTNSCSIANVDVFGEGGMVVRGKDEKDTKKLMNDVRDTIVRAHLCIGCGICTGRCDEGALKLDEQVYLDEEKCIHCGECLGPCPVIGYGDREFEF
ncbi:MAG: phosphoadenosine phosphosulfate reductase family protein [Thermoplasmata archaeon]|nr:MAG: phosphoadenosine phosphosulfate reductase family protein [Thermoplasmata archaeon]